MPLTEKQREYLLNCNKRWNVKTGATGSGKTYVDIAATIPKRILSSKNEGLIVLMGNTRGTLDRNILEPMRAIWGDCVGNIRSDNTVMVFGKKCYALGADNKKHVSRIQGATFEYVYGDEVTTWSEEVFQMLKSRLRCEHSHFDGTCNPDNPKHWFKAFLESDADIYQQSYVIDDGMLPADVVAALKKEYAGTVYYDRFILGKWALAEGLIYRDFANHPQKYTIEDAKNWLSENQEQVAVLSVGVDFGGTASATKFQATVITKSYKLIAVDEEYIDHKKESVDPNDLNRRYARFMKRVIEEWGAGQTRADSAEQILIRGLFNTARSENIQTQVKNALKMPITDRIKLTISLMGQGRLFVTKKCEHLIDALSSAVYDDTKMVDTRLDDGTTDIDSLDAFEYSFEPYYKQLEAAGHNRNKDGGTE